MALTKIKRPSVSDEVYNQIWKNIMNKYWEPCSKLPSEVELAETLGVSRVSVRNAIKKLAGQGILESRHGEGTFVSDLSIESLFNNMMPLLTIRKEQLVELYSFRRVLETGNIRLLKETISQDIIDSLCKNYEEMGKCVNEIEEFVKLDMEFHSIIAKGTKNSIVSNMYNIVREGLYPNQLIVQGTFGTKGALKYHKLIAEAITAGDFLKAERVMDEHMSMTITNIKTSKQNIE